MNTFLANNGTFINYYLIPEQKYVQLSVIEKPNDFENILLQNNGKQLFDRDINLSVITDKLHPFYYRNIRLMKIYKLENGCFAVDQSDFNKTNPFYICKTSDDIKLVAQYLHIYYVEDKGCKNLIIQCNIYSPEVIKTFLFNTDIVFVENISNEKYKLFRANEGKFIYVGFHKSKEDKSEQKSMILPTSCNKEGLSVYDSYYDLVIYDSIEVMNMLGVFDDQ